MRERMCVQVSGRIRMTRCQKSKLHPTKELFNPVARAIVMPCVDVPMLPNLLQANLRKDHEARSAPRTSATMVCMEAVFCAATQTPTLHMH